MRESDFLALWEGTDLGNRYHYVLNVPLIGAIFLLIAIGWGLIATLGVTGHAGAWILGISGAALALLTVIAVLALLHVRLRGRASGVLLTDDSLVWKDGHRVELIPWKELRPDAMDFRSGGRFGRLEGALDLATESGVKRLPLFNPFMRLYALETLMSHILVALKETGTPGNTSRNRARKQKKSRRQNKNG
jgi:hypothetical protein